MTYDEEDQSNEELALAEICGSLEFETINEDQRNDFAKSFGDEISHDFRGATLNHKYTVTNKLYKLNHRKLRVKKSRTELNNC